MRLAKLFSLGVILASVFFIATAPVPAQKRRSANPLAAKFKTIGGEQGELGAPTGAQQRGPRGGRFRLYQNGGIFWSARSGVHAISGAAFQKYTELGGATGAFGYPVSDLHEINDGGKEVVFQHGVIMLSQTGAADTIATPWATFREHGVTVSRGVKMKKQSAHTTLLLPPEGGSVSFTCGCVPGQRMELGRCETRTVPNGISCTKGTCSNGCAITIVSNQK